MGTEAAAVNASHCGDSRALSFLILSIVSIPFLTRRPAAFIQQTQCMIVCVGLQFASVQSFIAVCISYRYKSMFSPCMAQN